MNKIHIADAVFVLTTMIVCSSLLTTMSAVTLFPEMMATPFPVTKNRDCPLFCAGTDKEMHQPICGSNGTAYISYDNECFMRLLNCRYNTNFTKIHEGLCKTSSSSISETVGDGSPIPADSFQTTTTGMDIPSSHTSSNSFASNNSSSTNSYEVYENVGEYAKESNSTTPPFATVAPDTTVTPYTTEADSNTRTPDSSTEAFKSFANSDIMNSTTGTSSSMTTQEFSNLENSYQMTTPTAVVKDLNNSSSENSMGLEVTAKYFENGSDITSETTFFKSPAISNSIEQLKSDDNVQPATVGSSSNTTVAPALV